MDTLCIEMIPFCAKHLRGKDVKVVSGADGACFPSNPNHPTYSVHTLRCLFISYLYLFKWVKWNPTFITHGAVVSSVLGGSGKAPTGLPMVMEVGSLDTEILAHHPHLSGNVVHNQVHPSFIDRSLPSVLLLFFIILFKMTRFLHEPKLVHGESSYWAGRKVIERDDGISETSQVMIVLRIFISNMTRLWMVSPNDWKDMAEKALEYVRAEYPILVGGFVGLTMGDFKSLLLVCTL